MLIYFKDVLNFNFQLKYTFAFNFRLILIETTFPPYADRGVP